MVGSHMAFSKNQNALQLIATMDPLERRVLAAFDPAGLTGRAGPRARSLAELGDPAVLKEAVAALVERGCLRVLEAPDVYERTENGRLQLAGPRDVTMYTRPGCHLCEEAKARIAPLLREFQARLTEINIDEEPELRALYDYDVPVIFIGTRKAAKHRVDIAQFRRQLLSA